MQLHLPARPPFSLPAVIKSHGWYVLAPFESTDSAGELAYIDRLSSGKVIALNIREVAGGVNVLVEAALTQAEQAEIGRKVRWMLDLDQDFSSFYAIAKDEPKLQSAVAGGKGRILRSPTLFEDVLKTILTTNTLWAATIRMARNLVNQLGDPLPSDPEKRAFPTPESLTAAGEAVLRAETRLGYRAPYVQELAQRVANGELDLEALKSEEIPTPELRKRLLALKGIGGYAAANLLMLLGRYDFIPVDSWALKMVSLEWHDGKAVGPAEVEAAFERWGPWKGLAYWLWDWKAQ
jgi:3-methyladenine DNA glycosylase/8-oxoguanine DNA glycosylase